MATKIGLLGKICIDQLSKEENNRGDRKTTSYISLLLIPPWLL